MWFFGWFEVYKIQVLHVTPNRKFKQITLNGLDDEIIYQRGEDEDLPINQPLYSLCGYQPTESCDTFQIGDEGWNWGCAVETCRGREFDPVGIPISKIIYDLDTDSCVQIWCEFVEGAIDDIAQIRVLFLDEQLKMRVLRGQICITTVSKDKPEYDIKRKRLLQLLPSHPSSAAEKEIMLDRSVVTFARNGNLRVEVDLIYSIEPPGDEMVENIFSIFKSGNTNVPSDDGTCDIKFEPESGTSPVVKVELSVFRQPKRRRYLKREFPAVVKPDRGVLREPEVVGLEDLNEEMDLLMKSIFDD